MVTPRCFLPATRFVIAPVLLRNEATPPIFPPAKLLKEKKREEGNEVIGSQFRRNVLFFFCREVLNFFQSLCWPDSIRSVCVLYAYFVRWIFFVAFNLEWSNEFRLKTILIRRCWIFISIVYIYIFWNVYFELFLSLFSFLLFPRSKDRKETFVIEMKGDAKDRPSWGFWWDG